MSAQSMYLKQPKQNAANWMKLLVYFVFYLAVFFNLINRFASPILYVFIVLSIVFMVMRKNIRAGRYLAFLAVFMLYTILACFWSKASDPFGDVIRVLLKYAVFAFCLYNIVETKEDCENCLRLLCFSGLSFSVFSAFFYGLPHVLTAIQTGERLGEEICGINPFGLYAGLTVSLCLYFAKNRNRIHYYALLLLPLLLVFASSSRKAMLLVFCAIVYFLAIQKMQKSFGKGLLVLGTVLGALFLVLQLPAFEQVLQRLQIFFETTVQGSTTADQATEIRIKLIGIGMDIFKDHALFGNGTNSFRHIASTYFSNSEISAHNTYVDILANFGMIGFLSYYVPVLILAWNLLKGVLREIPVFYCMLFVIGITVVLLDMSYVSYHFIVPYVFYSLFDRATELYRDDLKAKIIRPETEDSAKEVSKYLK